MVLVAQCLRLCKEPIHLFSWDFKHLEVVRSGVVEVEPYGGAHLVKALEAVGAGVDVEYIERMVVDYTEDMAMAADEDGGRGVGNGLANAWGVAARVAADVGHEYVAAADLTVKGEGVLPAGDGIVNVAADSDKGAEGRDAVGEGQAAYVARMQDNLAIGEKVFNAVVPMVMRVAYNANLHAFPLNKMSYCES